MKKTANITWILYFILGTYGIVLSWFVYVGPITTWVVVAEIAKTKPRIVVSLTTTPYRIDKIRPTLDALLDQSIKPDSIYLNIPNHFKRDDLSYIMPAWLQEYSSVTVIRGEDHGPITKLLPTLEQEVDPETIIITVDDDVWYPRHVVRDLVHYMLLHPNSVATPVNIKFTLDTTDKFTAVKYKFKHGSKVDLVVGAAGVAYRRKFFAKDFSSVTQLPSPCNLSDDLVISMYLAHNQIPIRQAARNSLHPLIVPFTYKEQPYRFSSDALSFGGGDFSGNHTNYTACLRQVRASSYAHLANFMVK